MSSVWLRSLLAITFGMLLIAANSLDTTKTELVETTSEVSHPALVEGDFEVLEMETSSIGPWGFVRRSNDDVILVIINFSSEVQEVVIGDFPFQAEHLIDLITGQKYPAPDLGSSYPLTLAPALVLYLSEAP